jgi:transposase InsO family protein
MPWKTMDVQEQRVRFVVAAHRREKTMVALCQEFGISRPVGYEWLKRYHQGGAEAIAERSRRPQQSPRRTGDVEEQRVLELRRRYPDWGARKLRVLLQREGIELARNTIHRILLRHDLIAAEDRHLAAVERFERSAANELWQMDFKGPKLWYRKVGPLSVIDDHSRYLIVLHAVESTHTDQVREPLRDAFCEHGVPEAMLMDHGTPWWSVQSTGGMTKLSLWLMQQGIALHWSRVRHPQTQGKVERFHGELQRALARRRLRMEDVQSWLDEFRWEHNHVRPHEALTMQTPASRWRPSLRRYDPNPPRWEYPAGAKVLKVDAQGKLTLAGKNWKISLALAGEWVEVVRLESRCQVYYCTTMIREIDLGIQRSTLVKRWIPRSKEDLKL